MGNEGEMSDMARYGVEARGLAQEIDEGLSEADRRALGELRRQLGDAGIEAAGRRCAKDALDFLGRPQSRQSAVLKRCATKSDQLLVLGTARSLAFFAAWRIECAERVCSVKGAGYRAAAARVATLAMEPFPAIAADRMAPPGW